MHSCGTLSGLSFCQLRKWLSCFHHCAIFTRIWWISCLVFSSHVVLQFLYISWNFFSKLALLPNVAYSFHVLKVASMYFANLLWEGHAILCRLIHNKAAFHVIVPKWAHIWNDLRKQMILSPFSYHLPL